MNRLESLGGSMASIGVYVLITLAFNTELTITSGVAMLVVGMILMAIGTIGGK